MARKGQGRKRRQTYVYINRKTKKEISELSKFVPALNDLKGKSRITTQQKALLTKAKKRTQHTESYRPITAHQEKLLRAHGDADIIVGKGVRAVRLRNTSENAKLTVRKNGMLVTSNGRTWEYHPVSSDPDDLSEYGAKQLERGDVEAIGLWTNRGRVDATTDDADDWNDFLYNTFSKYEKAKEFTKGIVVLIKKGKTKRV